MEKRPVSWAHPVALDRPPRVSIATVAVLRTVAAVKLEDQSWPAFDPSNPQLFYGRVRERDDSFPEACQRNKESTLTYLRFGLGIDGLM